MTQLPPQNGGNNFGSNIRKLSETFSFVGIFFSFKKSIKTISAEGPPSLCRRLCCVCHRNAKAAATSRGPGGAGDTRGGNKIKGGKLRR